MKKITFLLLFVATLLNAQHTSIVPIASLDNEVIQDSIIKKLQMERSFFKEKWLGQVLVNEHLLDIKKDAYRITLDPILHVRYGKDSRLPDSSLYINTRGFRLKGRIGKTFAFYSDFRENQAYFPAYQIDKIANIRTIPSGLGVPKRYGNNAYDFAVARGFIEYQPNKVFNFKWGNGSNFIGDGYRSLLLSDNNFPYPSLRITATLWKLKYWVLYTKMLDINSTYSNGTYVSKYVTSHYLNWDISDKISGGIFETVVYADTLGTRGYDVNYLNPVIFYRPIEFSLGSSGGNVLLGGNIKWKITPKITTYGQILLDEFNYKQLTQKEGWWANKFAFQLGLKSQNLGIDGLFLQTEMNLVRPYTYSYGFPAQNYGHYNEPLAHPLGSNFLESVSKVKYQKERFVFETEFLFYTQGKDTLNSNWGTNIYKSYRDREQDYGNKLFQGIKSKTVYWNTEVGYIINPAYDFRFELGYTYRKFTPENETVLKSTQTNYFYFGLNTKMWRVYEDY